MTFRESLTAFSDRVLDKALGTVEAGACVPSHLQFCACVSGAQCALQGRLLWIGHSCFGMCNYYHSSICC